MADKNYYKQQLKTILSEGVVAKKNAQDYLNLVGEQDALIGEICARIRALTPVSSSEAKTYINYKTGGWKGGSGMPHCLDPELKALVAEHERVVTSKKQFDFKSGEEGVNIVKEKMQLVATLVDEIKRTFDIDTAKAIIADAKAETIKETGIEF